MIGKQNDTICAIATAAGHGAIAVIRMSGSHTFSIIEKVTQSKNKKLISTLPSHSVHLTYIVDKNEIVDEVLITLFKNPHSYTSEDTVEISCHGSVFIQQAIVQLLIRNGARMAQAGEFTMRAFMNGKMDLSQAEAVADLISSHSKASHHVAMNQMRGGFSHQLEGLRGQLLHFISMIELELDFSEEEVEFANRAELQKLIEQINLVCYQLAESFKLGNVIKNGVPVAIVGKPNSGKSTLLNALLNEEKAIVSEIAGTTRDVIEDVITIEGLQVRFIDTAGIRDTTDTIESLGIERTFEKIKKATVILLMTDATDNMQEVHNQIKKIKLSEHQTMAVVMNKIDKLMPDLLQEKMELMSDLPYKVIGIAAKPQTGLHQIHDFILQTVNYKKINESDTIVTNARHYESLVNTYHSGLSVVEGLENNLPSDLLAEDIREMLRYIAEITGEITTNEVLGNIFKNFCIGK